MAIKYFTRKSNIVIYTAIFNNYDKLIEPQKVKGCDFICFTDNNKLESNTYKIIHTKGLFKDPARSAKIYKILPQKYLPQYKYSLWIDGNTQIKNNFNIKKIIKIYLRNYDIALFDHPERDCIFEEAKVCIKLKKDREKIIIKQITKYKHNGYPKNYGLIAGGFILRKNMSKATIKINNEWWNEINNYSKRDQLSFNYVCWKNNINYSVIPGNIWDNQYIIMQAHIKQ